MNPVNQTKMNESESRVETAKDQEEGKKDRDKCSPSLDPIPPELLVDGHFDHRALTFHEGPKAGGETHLVQVENQFRFPAIAQGSRWFCVVTLRV